MTQKLETAFDFRHSDDVLFFSDVQGNEIVRLLPDGRGEAIATFPGSVAGIGWLPDGRMLVALMEDKRILRREADGSFVVHADW
jgi:sugar lactone lactonase YvrE